MCIIVYKAADITPPDRSTLKTCWDNNPDGAGYVFWSFEKGTWEIRKGFMKFDDFYTDFEAQKFTSKDVFILHFRIGTAGLKDGGNTHPFPLCNDTDQMRVCYQNAAELVFHNGVIGVGEAIASDTMCFIRDYLEPLWRYSQYDKDLDRVLEKVLEVTKSKWVILTEKELKFYGNGWIIEKGIKYSNSSYIKFIKSRMNTRRRIN